MERNFKTEISLVLTHNMRGPSKHQTFYLEISTPVMSALGTLHTILVFPCTFVLKSRAHTAQTERIMYTVGHKNAR